jgi:hypothetical protein
MPVCEALAYVELHRSFFDVVHVKYNDEVSFITLCRFFRLIQLGFMRELKWWGIYVPRQSFVAFSNV